MFLRGGTSPIDVYDTWDFKKTRQIMIPHKQGASSIAACLLLKCLYISDDSSKCIHRVDLSDSRQSRWAVNDVPCGLSVTEEYKLLVTLPISRRILMYWFDGDLSREINLDVSIDNPRHAIQLPSGQFVVCHMGETQHRVCLVDASGLIVASYGGTPGISAGQLYGPHCLALGKYGSISVADCYNHQVQILDSKNLLRCTDDITLQSLKLNGSWCIHLDKHTSRLFVGEMSTEGRVLVLAFRPH